MIELMYKNFYMNIYKIYLFILEELFLKSKDAPLNYIMSNMINQSTLSSY